MNKLRATLLPLVALLAGCWTFNSTEFPETVLAAPPKDSPARTVAVLGFDTALIERTTVNGYQTYYVPPIYTGHGRYIHSYRPGFYETVPTTTFIDQRCQTDVFARRAKDALESAGYVIASQTPAWTVEVQFEGPFRSSGEVSKEALWMIGTLFFCDYASTTWNAKLKIRDNKTGELVFSHDYSQKYETNVFGLIPLFGIASCDETSSNALQIWCLSALTDRALADATAFLAGQAEK